MSCAFTISQLLLLQVTFSGCNKLVGCKAKQAASCLQIVEQEKLCLGKGSSRASEQAAEVVASGCETLPLR